MSDLKTASDWLQDVVAAHNGISVTYRRGSAASVVTATPGSTVFRFNDEYGRTVRTESRDFLIAVSDLAALTEPERGDQIEETQDGVVYTYEVLAPNSEPCWRYSGPFRKIYRIHTKLVDQTA